MNFSTVTSSPKYVGGLREIYISIKLSLNCVYNVLYYINPTNIVYFDYVFTIMNKNNAGWTVSVIAIKDTFKEL